MTEPDEAKQYAQSRIHGAGRAAWMAVPIKDELAMAYRAGQAASAERIKVLEEALAKANKPRWFYADDEGSPFDSVYAAVEAILDEFGPEDAFPNGKGVQRIDTMRDCAPTYAAVRILTEAEREARDDGFVFEVTECATEAEAIAALKEADQ